MSDTTPGSMPPEPLSLTESERLVECYRQMLRIRKVEQRLAALLAEGRIPGFIHSSIGQESVPVAVSQYLSDADTVAITHRGHGQALAKGMALAPLFAELMGRETGVCRGHGGSMHIADARIGVLGANGIVGGGFSLATGSALAHKLDGEGRISVAYFGDGAMAEGVFHECLNVAALWDLPCLFVCENNGWSEFSRTDRQFRSNLKRIAKAFGIGYRHANGLDVGAVLSDAGELIGMMRARPQPLIFECRVERFHGHFEGDSQLYRDPDELDSLAARDCILRLRERLLAVGIDEVIFSDIETLIDSEIEAAVAAAEAAAEPSFERAATGVYAP